MKKNTKHRNTNMNKHMLNHQQSTHNIDDFLDDDDDDDDEDGDDDDEQADITNKIT